MRFFIFFYVLEVVEIRPNTTIPRINSTCYLQNKNRLSAHRRITFKTWEEFLDMNKIIKFKIFIKHLQ